MADILRPYQENGINGVISHWNSGTRRVLLVAPTGSGKTVLASEFCQREMDVGGAVLFVVHRTELLDQTAERLEKRFGNFDVGTVGPGRRSKPHARIQVGTVQSLLARDIRPNASLAIFDEAHHYAATDWAELFNHYQKARLLGLTATPERSDGKPLGDLFDELVVAAKYSELLRDKFLVNCAIYHADQSMGMDLAQDPLLAYQRYAENSQCFVFCASVEAAEALAVRFNEAGIPAACIEAKTKKLDRKRTIDAFKRGELRVITNVNTMTEGVDVPQARTVILARVFRHVGGYLQAAGRVLRPHPSKPHAILVDLVGAVLLHRYPTDDRDYSLEGDGIKLAPGLAPLTVCASCGATYVSRPGGCPECSFVAPKEEKLLPTIYNMELKAVFAWEATPADAKRAEYLRLREEGRKRGWKLYFVQREYRKLFGEDPVIDDATEEEQFEELKRVTDLAAKKGYKAGYAKVMFKKMFGKWPRKDWAA